MPTSSARPADLLYAALFSGAVGSAAVALLFLGVDVLRGEPFFTPSLMGSVFFLGVPPAEVSQVRLDLMALYTLVHLGAFTLLGTGISLAYARLPRRPGSLVGLAAALFGVLTVGLLTVEAVAAPGLSTTVGLVPLMAANAVASVLMAWLIRGALDQAGEPVTAPTR